MWLGFLIALHFFFATAFSQSGFLNSMFRVIRNYRPRILRNSACVFISHEIPKEAYIMQSALVTAKIHSPATLCEFNYCSEFSPRSLLKVLQFDNF
jgi:hypothetical protein